jgi:hypothetical protein
MNFYYDWNALNQAQNYSQNSNNVNSTTNKKSNQSNSSPVQNQTNNMSSSNQNNMSSRNSFQNHYEFIKSEKTSTSPYFNWTGFATQQQNGNYSSNLQLQQAPTNQLAQLSAPPPTRIPIQTPVPMHHHPPTTTPISFNQSQLWNDQNSTGPDHQPFYASGLFLRLFGLYLGCFFLLLKTPKKE